MSCITTFTGLEFDPVRPEAGRIEISDLTEQERRQVKEIDDADVEREHLEMFGRCSGYNREECKCEAHTLL